MMIMRMMIYAPLIGIGGIIMAVSKDATLSLVLVVAIPVLVGTIMLIASRGMPLFKAMQNQAGQGEPGAAREPHGHPGYPGLQPHRVSKQHALQRSEQRT